MLSVGEILKKTREKKGLTLLKIEKEIRIREKYLKAIEENNWNFFSSKIYISGIIKNYARYLDIDPKKTQAFFNRDYEKKEEVRFKKRLAKNYITPEAKKYFFEALGIIIFLFIVYFGYQLRIYLSPPKVTIISPTNNIIKREDRIKIIGKTEKESLVTIFNDRIYQDKEGVFTYDFPLKVGKNILTIEVIGANGKKTVFNKEFIKEE